MSRCIAFIVVVAALLAGCTTTKTVAGPTTTQTATTTTAVTATITATVTATRSAAPPGGQIAPESCGPLLHGGDGNIGNTICPDGHANVAAVDFLRDAGYVTIDLDPAATSQQVYAALCTDNRTLTNPIRLTLYNTAVALNGWKFPTDILDSTGNFEQSCPS
jgi:hypothetical protein